jgi:hypothetical protein
MAGPAVIRIENGAIKRRFLFAELVVSCRVVGFLENILRKIGVF